MKNERWRAHVLKGESRKGRQSAKNLEFPGLADGEHVARTVLSSCRPVAILVQWLICFPLLCSKQSVFSIPLDSLQPWYLGPVYLLFWSVFWCGLMASNMQPSGLPQVTAVSWCRYNFVVCSVHSGNLLYCFMSSLPGLPWWVLALSHKILDHQCLCR